MRYLLGLFFFLIALGGVGFFYTQSHGTGAFSNNQPEDIAVAPASSVSTDQPGVQGEEEQDTESAQEQGEDEIIPMDSPPVDD